MNEAFEKWWKEEGKEMKFYAGEYQEHRGIAKQAYLAATLGMPLVTI